jgi:hypothetical protein
MFESVEGEPQQAHQMEVFHRYRQLDHAAMGSRNSLLPRPLEQDLWSGWILTKVNGRRGSRLGRARTLTQPSIESALLGLAAIAKRRRERGYELMS